MLGNPQNSVLVLDSALHCLVPQSCRQNFPVQTLTHGARPFGAERAGAGSTRWHVTAPPLRFGTGLVTPKQSGGGRLERAQARQPTTWQRHHAAALRAAGLYTTRGAKGGHGGTVRFPPCSMCMAFTKEQSAFPLAGRAHCTMHRVGAEKWDL